MEYAEDPEAIHIAGYYDWTNGNDIAFEPSQALPSPPYISSFTLQLGGLRKGMTAARVHTHLLALIS